MKRVKIKFFLIWDLMDKMHCTPLFFVAQVLNAQLMPSIPISFCTHACIVSVTNLQ